MRSIVAVALVAACAMRGPAPNELIAKHGRHEEFRAQVTRATFCPHCGEQAPVTIELGAPSRVVIVIPTCYPHARSKVGDHDHIRIERQHGNIALQSRPRIVDPA